MSRIAVIGGGNMGKALVAGIVKAKLTAPGKIHVTDPNPAARQALKSALKVTAGNDNAAAVRAADLVLLCVKPQQMGDVLDGIKDAVGAKTLVISVAAGIRTDFIETKLGKKVPVIRVMPNTPALYGAGAMVYSLGRAAKAAHEKTAKTVFASVGSTWRVPEKDLDAVTALSGSGPAYVFRATEAMTAAGKALGLSASLAEALARQTVFGAGLMLKESPESATVLRERVTSPGGTTAAALKVFDDKGFMKIFDRALAAACRRSRELSQR